MTADPRFDVATLREALIRLSVPAGERLEPKRIWLLRSVNWDETVPGSEPCPGTQWGGWWPAGCEQQP